MQMIFLDLFRSNDGMVLGFGWGDEVIDAKTRSMMNLSMIGALGKMTEWETHFRGAIKNGFRRTNCGQLYM